MVDQVGHVQQVMQAGVVLGRRGYALLGMAGVLLLAAVVTEEWATQRALWAAALSFTVLSGLSLAALHLRARHTSRTRAIVSEFIEGDACPAFVADGSGRIKSANPAADTAYAKAYAERISRVLTTHISNPEAVFRRLQDGARKHRLAREVIALRTGELRLSVRLLAEDVFVWRFERVAAPGETHSGDEIALPQLIIGRTGAVLFMNDAARGLIGHRVKSVSDLLPAYGLRSGCVCDVTTRDGPVARLVAEEDAGYGRRAIVLLPPPDVPDAGWPQFHDLPVALLKIGRFGHVTAFNTAAQRLLGDTLTKGRDVAQLMEGLGRPLEDWLEETRAGRAVQHSEFLRLRREDRDVYVQVALNRVPGEDGPDVLAVLTDATELKTLEAQFVQSQKMQAIGQLAGGVAHDFNNLLTAISGHCDLLLLRHDAGDTDYADLQQINQNTNRAAGLVSQLLAFSRKQTLRPEPLDLRDTLADLTHLLNRLVGEKVTLMLSHDPTLGPIRADKRQLEQVLMNLVVNARDAMPNGGKIRVETESVTLNAPLERDKVTVPEGRYVVLRVSDQGVGISRDKVQKIFEPFFSTKRTGEGTGLGLSMVYGIVKQSGGFVFVDSKEGVGTCFSLMFPVTEVTLPVPAPVREQVSLQTTLRSDAVILLVEDEAPVRAFASRALRMRGFTVLEAESGEDALKALEDGDLTVDLFVTDVVMPGRDGPSWVREARKERPDVAVVFVSGYAEDKLNAEKDDAIRNSVFLQKPFSLTELTETVQKQLQ